MDLTLLFYDCALVMPAGLPGYEFSLPASVDPSEHGVGSSLIYCLPEAQIHIRLHDYFMGKHCQIIPSQSNSQFGTIEMSINLDPLVLSTIENCTDAALFRGELSSLKDTISIGGTVFYFPLELLC